jgi:hypothetical protein
MKHQYSIFLLSLIFYTSFISLKSNAQSKKNLIYVDKKGIIRYSSNNAKAYFFGVNYTAPFAYGYRALKKLNIDAEKEIDQDVYHLSRMGIDAFRVHVWDTEITDSAGNLVQNEHLRLFDYLVNQLEKRHIKILVTPLAFWGNGYPENDEKTAGFSSIYDKGKVTVNENAIRAQENYLKQFLQHINPYNKLAYRDDPEIIAAELNNEPKHSGPKPKVTEYVNRLAAAARSAGWKKPLFYNISESFTYADAVAKSNVDGFSFQWYPVGLVAGHEQKGNFLPHVDQYKIPFIDTIPEFKNKARMVYEFDAGDLLQSNMYPAMARSFRKAGFQWATQFAYDPLATAYANTEYQTHYLNLAYTPSKAISLLIAAKAFHQLPEKDYGTFPADTSFDAFRVSYKQNLSEMNTVQEFYYSNSTSTKPVNATKLQHVAGVGSSPVIQYAGSGAYFLDKLENGIWRLEVMPDAISIRDPFEKASLQKEVTRIQWGNQQIQSMLPDLGQEFSVKGINTNNNASFSTKNSAFSIQPGTYLILKKGVQNKHWQAQSRIGSLILGEFVAPKPVNNSVYVVKPNLNEVSADKPFTLKETLVGVDAADKVTLQINKVLGMYKMLTMSRKTAEQYEAEIPAELVTPGLLNYRIVIKKSNNQMVTFPGAIVGDPFAWDNFHQESWPIFVASKTSDLVLFDAAKDYKKLNIYTPVYSRTEGPELVAGEKTGQLSFKMSSKNLGDKQSTGWQIFVANQLKGRSAELASFTKLVIRAKTANPQPVKLKVAMIDADGSSNASFITLNQQYRDIEILLSSLRTDSVLLLPRPYPSFMPLWFKSTADNFKLNQSDKLEVSFVVDSLQPQFKSTQSVEIESIKMVK